MITGNTTNGTTAGTSIVIAVPSGTTTYSHKGLDACRTKSPCGTELYVVTDTDGNQDENADTPVT